MCGFAWTIDNRDQSEDASRLPKYVQVVVALAAAVTVVKPSSRHSTQEAVRGIYFSTALMSIYCFLLMAI